MGGAGKCLLSIPRGAAIPRVFAPNIFTAVAYFFGLLTAISREESTETPDMVS